MLAMTHEDDDDTDNNSADTGESTMHRFTEADIQSPHGNVPKSYLSFLAEQGQGAVVSEVSEKLRNLTEDIELHFEQFRGKVAGEISIKHKITLEGGAYKIVTEYAVKHPKAPPNGTIMWLGNDGNLATQNPRQLAMPFGGKPKGV